MTTVFIYSVYGDYDEGDEISIVFDSMEKAEKWDERMHELLALHNKYHEDGTVRRCLLIQSMKFLHLYSNMYLLALIERRSLIISFISE